jgi:hypothetical protein
LEALGREQLEFSRQQYAELKPLAERVFGSQIAAQEQQMRQGQEYYDYLKNTFQPIERGLAREAESFNTEAYRERMAQQAAADAAQAFQGAQGVTFREAARRGVNPASGAFGAAQRSTGLALAAAQAGGMNKARQQAEQTGWARRLDVVGLGRGLSGASTAAYGGATSAGTAGMNTAMAPGNQYMQGMGQAGQTYGNILSSQTSAYNAGLSQPDPFGSIVGMGLGAYAGGFGGAMGKAAGSDRRMKKNIELVGRDERTMLPLYEFEYINGDGRRFLGVMADEVEQRFPEAVITRPDGYKAVRYDLLGIEMIEVAHG